MSQNHSNFTFNNLMEKMDHDSKTLSSLISKTDRIVEVLRTSTPSTQSSSREVDTNLPSDCMSQKNLFCTSSYLKHPNDKSEILNLQACKKRKRTVHDVGHKDDKMKKCKIILHTLMEHEDAWMFNEVVDPLELGIPNYHSIIKHPMDLGTICGNLENDHYSNPGEFVYDVRLTFMNAMTFNPVGHDVHKMARTLLRLFEQQWNGKLVTHPLQQSNKVKKSTPIQHKKGQVKRNCLPKASKPKCFDINKRPMTIEEKTKLGKDLEILPEEKLARAFEIVKSYNSKANGNEIEFDIDDFDIETLWELDRLVTNWKKSRNKKPRPVTDKPKTSLESHGKGLNSNLKTNSSKKGDGGEVVNKKLEKNLKNHKVLGKEDIDVNILDNESESSTSSSSSSSDSSNSGSNTNSSGSSSINNDVPPKHR